VKQIFDTFLSLVGLIILLPILIIVSMIIFFTIGYPVIFSQIRPGLSTIPFTFYKFRTMTHEKDNNGNLLPDKNRLTKLGKFLRKTSLDELPSLLNVLKGDMSLVGPRPLLMEYLDRYSPAQARRHEIKPGITGWAQINGRNDISWEEKFTLDVWYVDNQSFWLDMKILFITIWKVLKGEGISHIDHVTMEKFQGNN
jgi:sugar transferase EpsL